MDLKGEESLKAARYGHWHRVPHRPCLGRQGRREARPYAAAAAPRVRGLLHGLTVAKARLHDVKNDMHKGRGLVLQQSEDDYSV